jgi:ABC-type dipeptide/oligopeptide/nickel transport system permease subunit
MKKWSWLLLSLLAGWYFFQTPTSERLQLPSLHHFMGTDFLGRDLLGRTMQAMTFSLALGILSALAAFSLGGFLGFWAGYLGGSIETLFSLVLDFFTLFPTILLALTCTLILGKNIAALFITLTLSSWITSAKRTRDLVLPFRELPYVTASEALGANPWHILRVHAISTLKKPLWICFTAQIATNTMTESLLSFLGLGIQPPYASLGTLIQEGFRALRAYPHLLFFPGTILVITLLLLTQWEPQKLTETSLR